MSLRANLYLAPADSLAKSAAWARFTAWVQAWIAFFSRRREEHQSLLRIEERVALGPKKFLLLVNCQDRRFLVATAGEMITPFVEVRETEQRSVKRTSRQRKEYSK